MEIIALLCNSCGKKVLKDDPQFPMWATMWITIPGMRLEQRVHNCPACFTAWNSHLQHGAVRFVDPELERMLREEEELAKHDGPSANVRSEGSSAGPSTGSVPVSSSGEPIPPPPSRKGRSRASSS